MDTQEIELEKLKLNVDIWKKVVDVQQHFNDLEMKVRNFGLLIISAFISAIGVSLKSQYEVTFGDMSVPIAGFLSLGALVVWLLVFFVDVYWYHPLLKGAVKQGLALEQQLKTDLPNIGLTTTIGDNSSIDLPFCKDMRSTTKAKVFYLGVSLVLFFLFMSLCFFNSSASPKGIITPQQSQKIAFVGDSIESKVQQLDAGNFTIESKCSDEKQHITIITSKSSFEFTCE
ncbi:hypothetical protein L4D00_14450 [Photobacterium swingsii]|uniref:hypothetical protein n=1 Tax=Photobacterium swingsii TaxID=680026 RepID=UPI003D1464E5